MLPCLPGRWWLSQATPHPGHPCQPALSPPSGPLAEASSEGPRLPGWQDFLWTWGPHETQEGARNPGLCLCLLPEGLRRSELQPLVCPFLWPPGEGSAVPLDPHQTVHLQGVEAQPGASLGQQGGRMNPKEATTGPVPFLWPRMWGPPTPAAERAWPQVGCPEHTGPRQAGLGVGAGGGQREAERQHL